MRPLSPEHYRREWERGQGGSQFEADFIGQINTQDPKYRLALARARQKELHEHKAGRWGVGEPPPPEYLRFRESMALAKQFQPYDPPYGPSNPDKPFGRDIRLEVIKLFEEFVFERKATPEERKRFQFFTGADRYNNGRNERGSDSPIDAHGVDAWLEYADENGQTFIATFDLTRRRVAEKNRYPRLKPWYFFSLQQYPLLT